MPLTSNIACVANLSTCSPLPNCPSTGSTARLHVQAADNPVRFTGAPWTDTRGRRETNTWPLHRCSNACPAGVPKGTRCKTASHLPFQPREHPSIESAAEYTSCLCNTDDTMPKQQDPSETISEFKSCVNMDVKELEKWLKTTESNEVGWAPDGGESTGHESGRIIVDLLQKDEDDYDDNDLKHMRKVISYVHRHSAQGPSKDVEHSRWRYSLMNWGNDPLKK